MSRHAGFVAGASPPFSDTLTDYSVLSNPPFDLSSAEMIARRPMIWMNVLGVSNWGDGTRFAKGGCGAGPAILIGRSPGKWLLN